MKETGRMLELPEAEAESDRIEPAALRLLISDDHKLMRDGLRGLLEKELGFQIVGEAANGLEAVYLYL
jgi:CheY-like chemotaxis protein